MSENGYPTARTFLPPRVYIFKDAEGTVLYVGKAKNIRSRVASYFTRSGDGRPKIAELRGRVRQIDFIATRTETEALVLEANLIKRTGRASTLAARRQELPYIVVTLGDEYPRVFATRGPTTRATATSGRSRARGASTRRSTCSTRRSRSASAGVPSRVAEAGCPA